MSATGSPVRRGDLGDVGALVAVGGRLLPLPAGLDGLPEELDLAADVVEVVLLLDGVAGKAEQPRDRVAVRAVSGRADRERPGRVRRDELDLHPLAHLGRPGPVPVARPDDLRRAQPGTRPARGTG